MSFETQRHNKFGESGFWHWFGVVEDRQDPKKLGRVRVRVFGDHTDDLAELPTEDLPWAQVCVPITDSVNKTPNVWDGQMVFGFWADGAEKQVPVVLAQVPTENNSSSDPAGKKTKGFQDQREVKEVVRTDGSSPSMGTDTSPKGNPANFVASPQSLKREETQHELKIPMPKLPKIPSIGIPGIDGAIEDAMEGLENSLPKIPGLNEMMGIITENGLLNLAAQPLLYLLMNEIDKKVKRIEDKLQSEVNEIVGKITDEIDEVTDEIEDELREEINKISRTVQDSYDLIFGNIEKINNHLYGIDDTVIGDVKKKINDQLTIYGTVINEVIAHLNDSTAELGLDVRIPDLAPPLLPDSPPMKPFDYDVLMNKYSEGTLDSLLPSDAYDEPPSKEDTTRPPQKPKKPSNPLEHKETVDEVESQYPYNSATETESGHIIEFDDTPGAERIMVFHRSGSYTEMTKDGSVKYKSIKDKEDIVNADSVSSIAGNSKRLVGGNVSDSVGGQYDVIISGGDLNIIVSGNANLNVAGNVTQQIGGNVSQKISGNVSQNVSGSMSLKIGGSMNVTTSGSYNVKASTINMKAGKINLN